MHKAQSLINHVALVLDGSGSMSEHQSKVIEVADAQIRTLAMRSEQLQQETRVSVYLFDDLVQCLIFDMDVMRLPSISALYSIGGMTAMIDALLKSQEDLATTSQIYGDHAFLTFVITDGLENRSRTPDKWAALIGTLASLRPGWSVGFLAPKGDRYGRDNGAEQMRRMGVGPEFIQAWDTESADGFVGAGATIAAATESFMTQRASGRSVMRSAFSTGGEALNTATVQAAALDPMPFGVFTVAANRTPNTMEMKDFIEFNGMKYMHGTHFYELTNATRSIIQPQKRIVVQNRKTDQAFTDDQPGSPRVRNLIGLSQTERSSVRADANKEFRVFVQSTNHNRHVKPGMSVLTLHPASA